MTSACEDPLRESVAGLILRTAEFIDDIREKYLSGKERGRDLPALRELTKVSLESIRKAAGRKFEEETEYARKASIYLSHRYSGRGLKEIGDVFGIGESTVSQASGRFEAEISKSGLLRRRVESARKVLNLYRV